MLGKLKFDIGSTRIAFTLILLLLLHIIVAAIIPQKDIASNQILSWQEYLGEYYFIIENLALDRIYYAPPFFILLGLLAINLIACNIKRFKIIYKTEKTLLITRHLGSILFHFSLILIVVGIILNFLYKFEGIFSLTEGQTVYDNQDSYFKIISGPLNNREFSNFSITLNDIVTNYKIDDALSDVAKISILPDKYADSINSIIYTNNPFRWNNFEIHYGLYYGFAPKVVLLKNDSTQILS
ncbi:MAG: cytochrome c biogenesis protein ResB, partial [Bacteroidota bacterium]|nr:cytochrome c biogenesis protein ResB [Bacteroidota bacterium]